MASLKQELYDTFQALINDRDQLRLKVTQAQETINLLEMEINALKSHGDEAFEKVADKMEITKHTFELIAESTSAGHWLRDIWLSEPSNAALLGAAEAAWEANMANPQKALNIIGKVLSGNTKQSERIKCNLLVSAIMLDAGRTEGACASANDALRQCGNDFKYKNLAGVAHYLRGRVFLEIKSLRQAYWDFSLAVFTPGYHEHVKHFQDYTENCILHQDAKDRLSTQTMDAGDDQRYAERASNHRAVLKLNPHIQVPLEEFRFEKATTTLTSLLKDP
jgi:FtsZ-binding cell division protein ZapB